MHSIAFSSLAGLWRLIVYLWCAFWATKKELKQGDYDTLVVHWAIPSGIVALALRIFTGQRYSIISHGTDIRLFSKLGPLRFLLRPIWSRAEQVYTVSSFLQNLLKLKTRVVPMPLPSAYETPTQIERHDGLFRILYVGRMSEQKRLHILADALNRSPLPDNWRLQIVGDGVVREQFFKSCEPFSEKIELSPPVAPNELPALYQNADVVVLPSVNEGFGLVLVEAMAYGCWLLGANSGGIPEIITENKNGNLFETAEELRTLLDTVATSKPRRSFSKNWFEQNFKPSVIGKRWGNSLKELR